MTDHMALGYNNVTESSMVREEDLLSLKSMIELNRLNNEREKVKEAGLSSTTPTVGTDYSTQGLLLARIRQRQQQRQQRQRLEQWNNRRIGPEDMSLTIKSAATIDKESSIRLSKAEIEAAAFQIADKDRFHELLFEDAQREQEQQLLPPQMSWSDLQRIQGTTTAAQLVTDRRLDVPGAYSEAIDAPILQNPADAACDYDAEIAAGLPPTNTLHYRHRRKKKRAELTPEEHKEQVRTRNREHAKNTRIRKKMRLDELKGCESELNTILHQRLIHSKRVESLQKFISARQNMLNAAAVDRGNHIDGGTQNEYDEKTYEWDLKEVVVRPFENFRFEQDTAPAATKQSEIHNDSGSSNSAAALVPTNSSSSKDSEKEEDLSLFGRMNTWDRQLRQRVFESEIADETQPLSTSVTTTLDTFVYEIQDGVNGIALNDESGIGFAQVGLVLVRKIEQQGRDPSTKTTTEKRTVIQMSRLRFRFERKPSNKLMLVEWTVIRDCCGLLRSVPSSSSSP